MDRGSVVLEPLVLLVDTNHFFILSKYQIICTKGNTEYDCCYAFKTMNPFLSLWPLPTYIKHSAKITVSNIIIKHDSLKKNEQKYICSCIIWLSSAITDLYLSSQTFPNAIMPWGNLQNIFGKEFMNNMLIYTILWNNKVSYLGNYQFLL